jgi:MFS family permease
MSGPAGVRIRSITLLVLAEIAAMSLWFISSATLADQQAELPVDAFRTALLVSGVPAGFVVGALVVAFAGLADRFDPRRVFAVAALLAAVANAGLLLALPGGAVSIGLRIATGFCLAGVYPVGMKIMVGWGQKDRGWLVGLLVGGLTLGSAAPHLLAFLGGSEWRQTTLLASCLAASAAILVMFTALGPHHPGQVRLRFGAVAVAWTDTRLRRAFLGYLGHMWELYALWSWIAPAAAASYLFRTSQPQALAWSKLTAFAAIGAGALLCPFAGRLADRIGKAELTIIAMAASGLSALMAAVVFGGPSLVVAFVFLVWGLSVIPDSAQFSALIADMATPDTAGSLMALQTALGFALTIMTVQLTPLIADWLGWPFLFCLLALGPLTGIVAMWSLQRPRSTPRP